MMHRGQRVEKIVRNSGYSLTKLAEILGISRNTLYNRFNESCLDYRFIIEIGNIIYYDFTIDFPEVKQDPELLGDSPIPAPIQEDVAANLWRMEAKHARLLIKYTKLLDFMTEIVQHNEFPEFEKELLPFKEEMKKEPQKKE
jgi:transcriptional regulator with XRE-family HTH domain